MTAARYSHSRFPLYGCPVRGELRIDLGGTGRVGRVGDGVPEKAPRATKATKPRTKPHHIQRSSTTAESILDEGSKYKCY
mmetsp:Transcript_12799/g.27652  ORF Transcript_12799/g.27652 Transcript_12799/m.27652 type:complete len:80 (+) Transcript_12799:580-819(+)